MITDRDKDNILSATDLIGLIEESVSLKRSGSSYVGECPWCQSRKALSIHPRKGIWKCFACDKGGDAISWTMEYDKISYVDACRLLAGKANITLSDDNVTTTGGHGRKSSFRDYQLLSSGLNNQCQISLVKDGNTDAMREIDRYESATEVNWRIEKGDDMILHYINLERQRVTYTNSNTGKQGLPFFRVRYSNPERDKKLDKSGNPVKYRSPGGSGNHLWLPEAIIRNYELGTQMPILIVTEGEKKADKLCLENAPAVGIAGIHNLTADNQMPMAFQHLIRKCGITTIVFMLDADCMDLSFKKEDIDARPKLFASAVFNFYKYFDGYRKDGINLNIVIAWHKDHNHKGVDDLLTYNKDKEVKTMIADLREAILDIKYKSELWETHHLSDFNSHRIKELWHVNNSQEFIEFYGDKIKASGLSKVKIRGRWYSVTEAEIVETNTMRDWEQYWIKKERKDKLGNTHVEYSYDPLQVLDFLKSNGYSRMEVMKYDGPVQKFVHTSNNLIKEVYPVHIKDFVLDYTRDLNINVHEKKDILRMLLWGSVNYFGPAALSNMYLCNEQRYIPSPEQQILIFQTKYWKITATSITEHPIEDLPAAFWVDEQIGWDPQLIQDAIQVERIDGKFSLKVQPLIRKSNWWRYLWNTSNMHWRDEYMEIKDPATNNVTYHKSAEQLDPQKIQNTIDHVIAKLLMSGYGCVDYLNYSNMRAMIVQDAAESEIGKSKGGSGKSIFAKQFQYWKPTYEVDGKKPDLHKDTFLYDGLDEKHKIIIFDDCRVNMDFELFFNHITGGIVVNSKGKSKFKISPKKMFFVTNHSMLGRDESTRRRQYLVTFSDYYNINRSPYTEFGKQLFVEWEFDDYNHYFNIVAAAIQLNLRYGLSHTIPGMDVVRRSLRQIIGEDFLDWAEWYWGADEHGSYPNIGVKVELDKVINDFFEQYPKQRNYVTPKIFKEKVKSYSEYKGYIYNPNANKDGRIRSNNKEYIIVAIPSDIPGLDEGVQNTELPF